MVYEYPFGLTSDAVTGKVDDAWTAMSDYAAKFDPHPAALISQ